MLIRDNNKLIPLIEYTLDLYSLVLLSRELRLLNTIIIIRRDIRLINIRKSNKISKKDNINPSSNNSYS